MRIGQLADRLRLNPKTIRYYEAIGLIPLAERTASGYRIYDESDEQLVAFIKTAQRLGISLKEIREILDFRDRGEQPCAYVRAVLRREVNEIDERIVELQRLREELAALDSLADTLPDDAAVCRLVEHRLGREVTDGAARGRTE
jgi:DNA-binding transcriptional MerR regulator